MSDYSLLHVSEEERLTRQLTLPYWYTTMCARVAALTVLVSGNYYYYYLNFNGISISQD